MYIKEEQFEKFAEGKKVEHFGNPYYKKVDGKVVNIIPKGECITVKTLTEDERKWWCRIATVEDVVEMEVTVGGWFPTDLVCGTIDEINGKKVIEHYSMETDLAKETGWLESTGNLGSRSDLFLTSKAEVAIQKLKMAGFNIVYNVTFPF